MRRLTRPAADEPAAPVNVIQFGEGNFLRAFVDWMFERINCDTAFSGRVQIVQPLPEGRVDVLNEQGGRYTVVLRGLRQGTPVVETLPVTCVAGGIDPYRDWQGFLTTAENPDLRFVVSNTTEAGIAYMAQPQPGESCPDSFPAKLTALVYRRWTHFGGAPGKGLIFLPCELIDRNGDKLKECMVRHARDWALPSAFTDWLAAHCIFANTLVDRIVTGFPEAEAAALFEELGYEDRLLVTGELFHLWVIEAPRAIERELPFREAGLNVVWTGDLTPYRNRKVRVLNGAHTASVLAAWLAGCDTVGDMMQDAQLGAFVRGAVFDEVVPGVALPDAERLAFAEAVLERFANPFIQHRLLDISLNSVAKWPVRVWPSVVSYWEARHCLPPRLTFSLAALLRFYQCQPGDDGRYWAVRDGDAYEVRDDPAVLKAFSEAWGRYGSHHDPVALARELVCDRALWREDLTTVPGFAEAVGRCVGEIITHGVRGAMARIEEGRG